MNQRRETRNALLRVFSFWILAGLACSELLLTLLAAWLRFSNPTGAPGRIGYVPPALSIESFSSIARVLLLVSLLLALVVAFLWRRQGKQAEWSWSIGTFGALVLIEIVLFHLTQDMWMTVF